MILLYWHHLSSQVVAAAVGGDASDQKTDNLKNLFYSWKILGQDEPQPYLNESQYYLLIVNYPVTNKKNPQVIQIGIFSHPKMQPNPCQKIQICFSARL